MDFSTLGIHSDLKKGLAEAEFISAMPVQEQVIANAFSGRDLYVQSQTGTGKTLAYLIVIMQRLISEPTLAGRKALIMVPTRELAVQVEDEARLLGKYLPFKTGAFYGGVGYGSQQQMLRDDVQILVGTPGRVLDLNASGYMNLMNIAFLVLDEADRMFDMGFYPDLRKLVKVVPPADRRQTMLFSATLNAYVKNLAYEYTKEPVEIEIEPEHITVNEIEQMLYHVSSANKMKLLLGILRNEKPESAIIFCNTKRYTEVIARRLRENGIRCEFISGDLPQQKRLSIIDDLKAGKIHYLVATDVAARGLDIEGLSLVVNYDLPSETENYVHRIGRTARAGKTGKAVSFASEQDVYELTGIERYLGNKIPSAVASDDMYGEDLSGRSPRRDDGHPRRQGPEQRGKPNRRRFSDSPRRDDGRRDDPRPATQARKGVKPASPAVLSHATENPVDSAVLGLPLEERMNYYKRKYAGKKPEENPSIESGESGERNTFRSRRRSRSKPERTRPAAAPEASNKTRKPREETGRRQSNQKHGKPEVYNKPETTKTPPETPQKGLLSRIFGIFTKKT
ncbi:MAG: DEAD/DEAH box helicase [Spirochaetaceae bacterium]|jgi:ATP-dependent RNA helicase RhlB|nr:DEAD/DEAH box helicase [Spirochaetaceae bacterium]